MMKVVIANRRLDAVMSSEESLQEQFGQELTKQILFRFNALNAAVSLGDFWPPYSGPERCHKLTGNRKDFFSIDLQHPYRLLITPLESVAKNQFPDDADRWKQITEIEIHRIENTHD